MTSSSTAADDRPATGRNDVVLVGRLAAPAEERHLPSGDVLLTWRLVVDRPPDRPGRAGAARRTPSVDTLDCTTWRGDVRRRVGAWVAGDIVEVEGALRRRFWRAGAQAASRCEVEVARARRVARAAAAPAPRRTRRATSDADRGPDPHPEAEPPRPSDAPARR